MQVTRTIEFEVTIPVDIDVNIETYNNSLDDYAIYTKLEEIKSRIEGYLEKFEQELINQVFEEID